MIRSRNRARGGVSGGSSPAPDTSPTGLAATYGAGWWFDASDAASINHTAGAVNSWTDKFSNSLQSTSTFAARPTTGTRTQNSLNAIDFDGTNNYMVMAAGFLDIGISANTIFVCFVSDNTGDAIQNLIAFVNGGAGLRWGVGFTTTVLNTQNRTTSNLPTTQALVRDTAVHIVGFRRLSTAIEPFVDGVEGTAGSNSENFTGATGTIGSQNTTTNRLNGIFCETAAYRGYLTDEHMDIEGNRYATKWSASWTNINFP